ncbi:hypothetical protein FBY33_0610 [Arthrobacter sp. SLBN-112]|jgi:hypothetical protein|uniref:hypothetical protein n=1 Tax=Arthrobacter sp. SLBN-112 TaxID=2768452 RepID=UPI001154F1B6|nr:hypothetical protein [Arthrobacter sp. SLBN-112]TQJ38612.1 hypothetical protein FBY33_0610 [Arthrobacter sp. SLBN-112]
MADDAISKNISDDEHLRQDVAPESEGEPQDDQNSGFMPGQTNAGQQVGGLASAGGYGQDLDPEAEPDSNNPV